MDLDIKYRWIARDKDGNMLWIYVDKPHKNKRGYWQNIGDNKGRILELFNHLFQFIKWEDTEPYNIEELLKGEKS